jgi:hypothetical protein
MKPIHISKIKYRRILMKFMRSGYGGIAGR